MTNRQQRDSVFIFTGPTISPEQADEILEATYLPPVKLGDIYRITELFSPRIIGIIDGYFNQVPAVWHKEILWAMSRGVFVFGAASMGALRAAELDQMGMTGCGEIYQAYKNGQPLPFMDGPFEDDDEVAVIHGPAELGYLSASDAMVNIRFSFARAAEQNIIDEHRCQQLIDIAKNLFYAERNYTTILRIAEDQGLPLTLIIALRKWLGQHSVDQKQLDAITLLREINACSMEPVESSASTTREFEHTDQWQTAIDEIDGLQRTQNAALTELRLKRADYFETLKQALKTPQSNKNKTYDKGVVKKITALHRSPKKLNQLFSTLWQANANQTVQGSLQIDRLLLYYLHHTGAIAALKKRAKSKQKLLAQLNQPANSHTLSELDRLQLCDWYFSSQLDSEMPEDIDHYADQLGFESIDSFYDIILGEYLYLNSENQSRHDHASDA